MVAGRRTITSAGLEKCGGLDTRIWLVILVYHHQAMKRRYSASLISSAAARE